MLWAAYCAARDTLRGTFRDGAAQYVARGAAQYVARRRKRLHEKLLHKQQSSVQ
jgi:hypothetical protein